MQRGAFRGRPTPGPFHCLACKTYVTGTESGHCPRCGFVPPSAPEIPAPRTRRAFRIDVSIIVLGILIAVLVLVR
jgi:hypothetical protein